jgi:hypothetical protein
LEALLGDREDAVDLGPIEDHLAALATSPRPDAISIFNCTARVDESAPPIRWLVERAAAGEVLSEDEARLTFRGLHVLGGAQDQQVFAPLLRLLRRPEEDLDWLLGDAITATLPRIAAGVFDGDHEALFAAISDRTIDEFARNSLFGAATFLTWDGRIDRDRMAGFLQRFLDARLADDEDFAWVGWLEAIALLGMRELAPLVHQAWRDGHIPDGVLELADFEGDLAEAERCPDDIDRFSRPNLGYIDDVLEVLEGFDEARGLASAGRASYAGRFEPTPPAINPWRGVGRNDPCPCGSGKKAKKCCMTG